MYSEFEKRRKYLPVHCTRTPQNVTRFARTSLYETLRPVGDRIGTSRRNNGVSSFFTALQPNSLVRHGCFSGATGRTGPCTMIAGI
ncbi:uncharacterized protein LAESUDRAFT_725925 [Laetiporus sulphureus 93-53]|uniref:Uncharacterized protein n=1 Tax=Laetiporus sulphureus 93-53 TaxID=1314785 RepID=A0A165E8Q0_9APHY|nr:uncharacterized protein LAESUDRAFT_725925 [Laetiporus sulphureus 93-53]KZT06479.1 hypothetical protein LAESUDRAFT_725925 [Laetiporus sulphureus 93-53]